MKAVWSFWSTPFRAHHHHVWASETHHRLAWVLSVMTARQHYPVTELHTDDAGARMLVDGLGLPFDRVVTSLNALRRHDPGWWALGKLYAYRAQHEPFVHLDNDVFLWRPLPEHVVSAPVLAQNPEPFTPGSSYYEPQVFEAALSGLDHAWLPEEWRWYRASGWPQRGDCCGVFGGRRDDFIRHYAAQAIRLIEHPQNQPGWARLADKIGHNILFEQYLLGACIDYHRSRADSPYRDIDVAYVFGSLDEAFDPTPAARLGYTHLIADAKRNPELAARLEARVASDHPEYYERCIESVDTRAASTTDARP